MDLRIVLRVAKGVMLAVAGVCLFLAQRADVEQRPTGTLLLAICCLLLVVNAIGIVHGRIPRRGDDR